MDTRGELCQKPDREGGPSGGFVINKIDDEPFLSDNR
jgi:hypothetical protein